MALKLFFFSPSKFAKNQEDFLSNQISKIHIEKAHIKFCKFVLGVRAKSSDDAVRGELGARAKSSGDAVRGELGVRAKSSDDAVRGELGDRAKSSGDAVRGELGNYPILYNILLNMIKFWLHLVKNNEQSSILADAFSLYNQTTNQTSESWVGCINEIFKCSNLQFIYNNISTLKETYVLKKVKQNLKEKFQTIWKNKLFNAKRKNIERKKKII
jgi:hypothetical protein